MLRHLKDCALLALGSNTSSILEVSYQQVTSALDRISNHDFKITKTSKFYKTRAFPKGSGPDFINCAVLVSLEKTKAKPQALLNTLHSIESDLGRVRAERWGQRAIDIDLIAYGDQILPNQEAVMYWMDLDIELQKTISPKELILPHPRIQDRAFVLFPLLDIAPDWYHPLLKLTVKELFSQLPQEVVDEVVEYNPIN